MFDIDAPTLRVDRKVFREALKRRGSLRAIRSTDLVVTEEKQQKPVTFISQSIPDSVPFVLSTS
jgi:hypothetical protein